MNFKQGVFFILGFCLLFVSCDDNQAELDRLRQENIVLVEKASRKDTLVNDYFKTIDEIEQNLSRIVQSEKYIVLNLQNGIENKKTKQQMIIDEIQFINTLLEKNKEKIASLTQQLSSSNHKIVELQNIIERLNLRIVNKDHELITIKNQLAKKNFQIDMLNISLDSLTLLSFIQEDLIGMQEEEINTAYYCYGTIKELRRNGVVTKEGGVIGLGKSAKLSTDFNKNYFEKIDISKVYSIPLAVKKAELLTNHPTNSYKLMEGKSIEKLVITNPKTFWEASKYLVIVVE